MNLNPADYPQTSSYIIIRLHPDAASRLHGACSRRQYSAGERLQQGGKWGRADMEHVDGVHGLQAKWGSCCLSYMKKSINLPVTFLPTQ